MIVALLPLAVAGSLVPSDLRVENLATPMGVQLTAPRFSWKLKATQPGRNNLQQTSYRIRVATDRGRLASGTPDLWDSGVIRDNTTYGIPYEGKALGSNRPIFWQVQAWDQDGTVSSAIGSSFTTGLKPGDWKAQWISYPSGFGSVPESAFTGAHWIWSDASAVSSTAAGKQTFSLAVNLDAVPVSARLAITADDQFSLTVNGKPFLSSDGKTDAWKRFQTVDLASVLEAGTNRLEVEAENSGVGAAGLIAKLVVNPGNGQKSITYATGDSAWQCNGKAAVAIASYGSGPWGRFEVSAPPPAFEYSRGFRPRRTVRRATLFGTALGLVDFQVNGVDVSTDLFTPGWSSYDKRVYYRAFDVTPMLRQGDNELRAIVGDGWYSGYVGYGGRRAHYGNKPMLKAQLVLEYDDGTQETVASDSKWSVTQGNIRQNDFLMGEVYDASFLETVRLQPAAAVVEKQQRNLEWFPGDPVRRYAALKPISITPSGPDRYILDFGQNLAGFARLTLSNPASKRKVTLRFAEVLDKDGAMYFDNLRGAKATDTYITGSANRQVWQPRFTFHGFRYAEVEGFGRAPKPEEIVAIAISSATPESGTLETSDPMLNKIVKNAWWTQKMNFIDIPTDCPQRDERLGWTGDAQAYIRTASTFSDVQAFFTKWLVALDDDQRADGQYPMVAPQKVADADGGPAWADAGVICPWTIYDVYGDERQLAQHYPNMKRFVEFMVKRSKPNLQPPDRYHCFGDWLQIGVTTPPDVIYMAYFAGSARLVAQSAAVLGKRDDAAHYENLYQRVRKTFNDAYVTHDGVVAGDTQCAYVLALAFDLLDKDRAKMAADRLVADIEKRDWHLNTGFVGTRDIMHVLSKIGRNDVAFRLMHNTTFPSWGFEVKNGATTIWERWDGWTPERGFQDAGMNSFAHYAYGAVVGWMFQVIGGIQNEEAGFNKILIAPQIDPKLTWSSANYDSVHGRIRSSWRRVGNDVIVRATIPPNTTAEIRVPKRDGSFVAHQVGSGVYEFKAANWQN